MFGLLALAVLVLLWFLFRPERLFINKTVQEPLPHSELTPRPERAHHLFTKA
jgi:hypothetical protein